MEKKKIYETIENDVMNTELNEETKDEYYDCRCDRLRKKFDH